MSEHLRAQILASVRNLRSLNYTEMIQAVDGSYIYGTTVTSLELLLGFCLPSVFWSSVSSSLSCFHYSSEFHSCSSG